MAVIEIIELKINNLFVQKGSNFIEKATVETFELLARRAIVLEAIPINRNWLHKLGFSQTSQIHDCIIYRKDRFFVSITGEVIRFGIKNSNSSPYVSLMEVYTVHLLQNVYHDIKGEELIIED